MIAGAETSEKSQNLTPAPRGDFTIFHLTVNGEVQR